MRNIYVQQKTTLESKKTAEGFIARYINAFLLNICFDCFISFNWFCFYRGTMSAVREDYSLMHERQTIVYSRTYKKLYVLSSHIGLLRAIFLHTTT